MSLEQKIADLVAASNSLTGTINSKMNEIDQKVDDATGAVPGEIKSMMTRLVHVDYTAGSDDNDGSLRNPYATLKKAIEGSPAGALVEVRVINSGDIIFKERIEVGNRTVRVVPRGFDFNNRAATAVRFVMSEPNKQIIVGRNSLLELEGFDIETLLIPDGADTSNNALYNNYRTSLISTMGSNADVLLTQCNIKVNHGAVMHQHSGGSVGYANLIIRNTDVEKVDLSASTVSYKTQFLIDDWGGNQALPFDLFGMGTTLSGAVDWSEMIAANTQNMRSNLV